MAVKQGNSDSHMAVRQLAAAMATQRWNCEQKAPDVEFCEADIVACRFQRDLSFPLNVAVIFFQELRSL